MSKRNKKKKQKKPVITGASKEQNSNEVCLNSKEKSRNKKIKLENDMSVLTFYIVALVIVSIVMFIMGYHFNNADDIQKKTTEIAQHEKEEMYKVQLESQLEIIENLKEYKSYVLDNNDDDTFRQTTTTEIDNMIREYISEAKLDGLYKQIMPELEDYYWLDWEEEFPDYLTKLEEIVSKFPLSYGINNSIKNELDVQKEVIEESIDDVEILERVWKLEEKCSENLQNLEVFLE